MFAKKRQKQIRNLLALGISSAMIAFYVLNLNLNSFFNTANSASNHKQQPVSILDNIEIREFDSQGQLRQNLTANRAEMITEMNDQNKDSHAYPPQGFTAPKDTRNNKLRLIQPRMIIYEKNNKPLTVTANEGLIGHRDKKTQLLGNVEINDINRKTKVFTQSLTIDSKANTLSTDQAISIESPTTSTTASGIEADLNKDQWQLLSGVKSVINP